MADIEVRRPAGEAELTRFAEIAAQSFVFPAERARALLDLAPHRNVRIVAADGVPAGGLILIPVRQWHHGRPVSFTGVAMVAIAPECRGLGVAKTLMNEAVREMRADGVALSGLYPSTETLYRRSGYERAGVEFRAAIDPVRLPDGVAPLVVRRMCAADLPAVEEVWREAAQRDNGQLDRNDYLWVRLRRPMDIPASAYVVVGEREVEGYVYFRQTSRGKGADLIVLDLAATTTAALRSLVAFFRDHRTTVRSIRIAVGPTHALLGQLPEQAYTLEMGSHWMLRLNDVPRALTDRGYPPGLSAELHLDVADDVLPENAGCQVLRIASGRATVEPGGEGLIQADVRALASLYTGFRTAADLRLAGLLEAPDDLLPVVSAAFAGGFPVMADAF